jgi:indolepyruvate ferredoxin oxidoreductase
MERQLIGEYFATVDELLSRLGRDNLKLAVDIASVPEQIRGYGHIKEANFAKAAAKREQLLNEWRVTKPDARAAA